MSTITEIKPQKNKKRVNIYLDGKFASGLDLENYIKEKLKVGDELSDEEVKTIVEKSEFTKTYEKLLRFATLRPRSKKEIDDWFYKRQVHTSIQDKLIRKLEKLRLYDDEEFARWWVQQRINFRPRGKKLLRIELSQKGVKKDVVEDVMAELDNEIDEYEIAKKMMQKNSYKWDKYDTKEKKMKASLFLARKGISWEVIKEVTSLELFDE